jgi:succinyl-diaminopimelate desuccinylase
VILNAHLDVVAAPGEMFSTRLSGNTLFGRGVDDCKGTAAIIMNLLVKLNGKASVGAIFSADEEEGGLSTRYMVRRGYTGRLALVLDGNLNRLTVAQKGILSLTLHAKGRACHSASPWRGDNAIHRLLAAYPKIEALFPVKATEKNNWHNTLSPTLITGGMVRNMVPDAASLTLNIRFTEKTDPLRLVRRIEKISGCRAEIHFITPFVSVSEKDPRIRGFYRALRGELKGRLAFSRMNGATDARYFVPSTPSVAITGLEGKGAHSVKERLDIRSVPRLEGFLSRFIPERFPLR